jgi:hypothetical protein
VRVGTLRAFAVVRDREATARLERIFRLAPDRELVGVSQNPGTAFEAIATADVHSVYVETELRGTHPLLKRLRRVWSGTIRAFSTAGRRTMRAGCSVISFDELAGALDAMYSPQLAVGEPPVSLEYQNLVLDSLYLRRPDEGFVLLNYDGEVVFYGPRVARFAGLPYPPVTGMTEADVHHLVGAAHRRDVVTSDDGRAFAERFWVRIDDPADAREKRALRHARWSQRP